MSVAVQVWSPLLIFCVASQFPGVTLDHSSYEAGAFSVPSLSSGFAQAFHISTSAASILSLPCGAVASFSFMWAAGKQIDALAESHLLFPSLLKRRPGDSPGVPVRGVLGGVLLGLSIYVLLVILAVTTGSTSHRFGEVMNNILIIIWCSTYILVLLAYISLRVKLEAVDMNDKEKFVNPLGIGGAAFSILIFVAVIACSWMPSNIRSPANGIDFAVAAAVVLAIVGVSSVYYFYFVKENQRFSDDEVRPTTPRLDYLSF